MENYHTRYVQKALQQESINFNNVDLFSKKSEKALEMEIMKKIGPKRLNF